MYATERILDVVFVGGTLCFGSSSSFFRLRLFSGQSTCTLSDIAPMHESIYAEVFFPPLFLTCCLSDSVSCCSSAVKADASLHSFRHSRTTSPVVPDQRVW